MELVPRQPDAGLHVRGGKDCLRLGQVRAGAGSGGRHARRSRATLYSSARANASSPRVEPCLPSRLQRADAVLTRLPDAPPAAFPGTGSWKASPLTPGNVSRLCRNGVREVGFGGACSPTPKSRGHYVGWVLCKNFAQNALSLGCACAAAWGRCQRRCAPPTVPCACSTSPRRRAALPGHHGPFLRLGHVAAVAQHRPALCGRCAAGPAPAAAAAPAWVHLAPCAGHRRVRFHAVVPRGDPQVSAHPPAHTAASPERTACLPVCSGWLSPPACLTEESVACPLVRPPARCLVSAPPVAATAAVDREQGLGGRTVLLAFRAAVHCSRHLCAVAQQC